MSRADDFVLELADASDAVLRAAGQLAALAAEYTYGDYATTLDAAITLTERPTMAQITATVGTTGPALAGWLAAGHGTNLVNTRR
jgi:hypothetical protein